MFDFSNLYTKTFWGLISDTNILSLLEIDEYSGTTFPPDNEEDEELFNQFMEKCVSQIFEGNTADNLLDNYSPKLAISERVSARGMNRKTEVGNVIIHTFITKDDNKREKKTYKLIDAIVNALDTKKREERLLPPIEVGLHGLEYVDRDPFGDTDASGWDLYTVIFRYEFIV